jgi:preprotein translocase subunit SecA
MSFINSIIKAFVGDKSQKDVKALQPYLNKIKTFENSLIALSHDELRGRTVFFKAQNRVLMLKLQLLKKK